MKVPFLIQRCFVLPNDLRKAESLMTGGYVKLDYMGSSEFEWGAIPKFQRDVFSKITKLEVNKISHNGVQLWFASEKNEVKEYGEYLKQLIDDKIRLKEGSGLAKGNFREKETNCWFDLTNNLFFARDEKTINNLFKTIPNSVRFMDSQNRKAL